MVVHEQFSDMVLRENSDSTYTIWNNSHRKLSQNSESEVTHQSELLELPTGKRIILTTEGKKWQKKHNPEFWLHFFAILINTNESLILSKSAP